MDEHVRANLAAWEAWTPWHVGSAFYDVPAFLAGRDTLSRLDLEGVGEVRGKRLLHLQCHFGLDTLSWARHGATVTGVDFSPTALAEARRLAQALALPATFVESDVYALPGRLEGEFDVVYTSQGALIWLPDLAGWARVIAHFLKPGGRFFVFDGHPFAYLFDDAGPASAPVLKYRYFDGAVPLGDEADGTYADPQAPIRTLSYVWLHPLSTIVSALIGAGLVIESFAEHRICAWPMYAGMVPAEEPGFWRIPEGGPDLPMSFTLACRRPA